MVNKPKLHPIIRTDLITELEAYYKTQTYIKWVLGEIIQPVHIIGETYAIRANQGFNQTMVASDTLQLSSPGEETTGAAAYEKQKEIQILIPGEYRVNFWMKHTVGGAGEDAYGKIYKNGAAFGVEKHTDSAAYASMGDEDLTFDMGDYLQLYAYESGAGDTLTKLLRVYGTKTLGEPGVVIT